MKISIPIPGEKEALKEALNEAKEKYGQLSKKEKEKIAQHVHRKSKRKALIVALAGAIGIGAGAVALPAATKAVGKAQAQNRQKERELKYEIFRDRYFHDTTVNEMQSNKQELSLAEKEMQDVNTKEDLLKYLKDLYIEQYEIETGDTTRTTEDIHMYAPTYEDYIFEDLKTHTLVTHGDYPDETRKKLNEQGMQYKAIENAKIYKVTDKNENVIDCISLQNKDGKSTPVNVTVSNNKKQENAGVLQTMAMVIKNGWEYYQRFGDTMERQKFIESVNQLRENNKQKEENSKQEMEETER